MVKEFFEIDKRLSKKKITKRCHVAAPERATWYADVIMMSPGGSGLLTSAVGPADVSIDRQRVDR